VEQPSATTSTAPSATGVATARGLSPNPRLSGYASGQASLAQHYMASAHHQNVEQQSDMDAWGTGKIISGILMMTIAFTWFFGGLLAGIIFFFPSVLMIAGMVALINGVLQKVNR
jgi:hypothetical protein